MEPNLLTHLFIETYFKSRGLLTEEHFLYGNDRMQLFESYGVFNGCEDGAEEILSCIDEFKKSEKYKDAEDNKLVLSLTAEPLQFFTKHVRVLISKTGNTCAYTSNPNAIGEDGKFEYILLKLNVEMPRWALFKSIMHELTHAYQDYNLQLKGRSLSQHSKAVGYNKTAYYMMNEKRNEYVRDMARLMYNLNFAERGAHIASLFATVKEQLQQHQFKNIKEAMEFIKDKCIVYKNYVYLKKFFDEISSFVDPFCQNEMLRIANDVAQYDFKSYNRFIKWAGYRLNELFQKFEKNLYLILDKYLVINEYMLPSDIAELIFEEKK